MGIDIEFMQKVDLLPNEKVLVGNITNGNRFETYVIPAPAGSKAIVLNGAVAHLGKVGDLIVIMSFGSFSREEAQGWKPGMIVLDDENKKILRETPL